MSADHSAFPTIRGFGSVSGVPLLPDGFRQAFRSIYVELESIGLHAVVGGSGPPLLLVPGWPQNWYAWSKMMMPLSERFTVIAVDPRGMGLSDKPADGFDADTPAADLFGLMDRLGHERFHLAGHDVGMWIAFAMAVDRPDRVRRVGLGEAIIPGVFPTPPAIADDRATTEGIWQNVFNRMSGVNESMVRGREETYFGFEFDNEAGGPGAMPRHARDFYIEMLRCVPGVLKGSFDYYRGMDDSIPQYRERAGKGIRVPVLAFAGELGCGAIVGDELRKIGDDVRSVLFEGCGHFVPEQQPERLLEHFLAFFAADSELRAPPANG